MVRLLSQLWLLPPSVVSSQQSRRPVGLPLYSHPSCRAQYEKNKTQAELTSVFIYVHTPLTGADHTPAISTSPECLLPSFPAIKDHSLPSHPHQKDTPPLLVFSINDYLILHGENISRGFSLPIHLHLDSHSPLCLCCCD